MKRIGTFVILIILIFTLSGCKKNEATVDRLFEGLKNYDREIMSEVLTDFPDNSSFVYLDDIFNDEAYIKIYQALFTDITYEIKKIDRYSARVQVSMPDVQKLFTDVSAWVLSMALEDEELSNKLAEDDYNGVLLIQEIMYSYVTNSEYQLEEMTTEFILRFEKINGETYILCDDELRALITGNFFLSKNIRSGAENFAGIE